ncbi:MAG: hypothetical protein R3B06_22875 [Kofleriaceae bacterium]
MTLPRAVHPGRFLMVNRRCTQQEFLLRPDAATNQTYLYCLAVAAQRFQIDVLLPSTMSNHHHDVILDRFGNEVRFREYFHMLLARSMNALRGRRENFWSSDTPCTVELDGREAVMDKLVYAAVNPVEADLVERVHHWPGVNGLGDLLAGRTLTIERPRHFFREEGVLPAEVTLTLVIPPELGDPEEVRRELRERVAAAEEAAIVRRRKAGRRVLGRRGVKRQPVTARPATFTWPGGFRPTFATRDKWRRVAARQRDAIFLDAYRRARHLWLAGFDAVFPAGTYWLARFARVTVAAG